MTILATRAARQFCAGASLLAIALMAAPAQAADNAALAEDTATPDESQAPGNTIVVTAAGYEQTIVEAPASISVLTREDLEERRFGSLAEALQDIEGVDVGNQAGKTGGLNISIRGMAPDYTLVLIDGRRQNSPGSVTPNGFGESSTSFMPPIQSIERIEVVRGPMSTLYGSDAMGGVINIITRKVGQRWTGSVTAEGTFQQHEDFGNIYSASAYVQGPIVPDLVGLTLRGSYLHRDEASLRYIDINGDPIDIEAFGRSATSQKVRTFGGKLTFTPHADHDLWFEFDRALQAYDNSAGQLGTQSVQGGYAPELEFNRDNYVLAHTWRTGLGTLETTLTRNTTETVGRTIPPNTPGKVAGSARTLEATNSIVDSRFVGDLGPIAYTIGGQYWNAKMIDAVATAPYEFDQWAGFLEATWSVVDGFNLTGGARYDNHSTFGGKWSPRAYAVWNINDMFTLKGGVSRGFKTPQLNQIAEGIVGFGQQGRLPLIGSPGLKPETSTTYEAGFYIDTGSFFSGNVTLFKNQFTNKIATGPGIPNCQYALNPNRPGCLDVGPFPAVDLFGQSINIDEAETRGVEAAARFKFTDALSLGLNYTYTESEVTSGADAGQPLVAMPKHMLNGNLRWQLAENANVWARGEVRSSRYRGANAVQTAVGDFRGYELFHIGGSVDLDGGIRLSATINNVFDRNFVEYIPYRNATNALVYAEGYAINQEGRRLWLSAAFDF